MDRKNTGKRTNAKAYRTEVQGNVVRKVYAEPKHYEKRERPAEELHRRRRQEKNTLSVPYCLFLAAACVCTLILGAYYLQQQALATSSQKKIASLESELTDLKKTNADDLNRIETSINLEEIRDIAINELGMVYASEENVVLYKNTSRNYVSQYDEVPQEEKSLLQSVVESK